MSRQKRRQEILEIIERNPGATLGDAAALCDGLAREIAAENKGRGGKGAVTKLGLKLEAIAKRCGDEIWAMREKIDVPTQQS